MLYNSKIKQKRGLCPECNDEKEKNIIGGKCPTHYWRETNRKAQLRRDSRATGQPRKEKKAYKINNRSKKGQKVANHDAKFFREIWNERPPYSEVSGKWLSDTFNPVFCSHVLSKAAFPRARHWKENIMLKTFEEHRAYETDDPTTKEYKERFKKVLERREELIIRYYETKT